MKQITLVALLGVAALQATTMGVRAQTAPTMSATKQDAKANLHYFHLKNVSPSLMAYWIDPKHNPLPGPSERGFNPYMDFKPQWPDATVDDEKTQPELPIPASVGRAIAVNQHDVLSVEVGNDDVESLRELINALDQPLRSIEIEAQFVEMDKADLKKFAFYSALGNDNPSTKIGFMRNQFTSTLNELIANNTVALIAATRVTAVDNVVAQFGISAMSEISSDFDAAQRSFEPPTNKIWLNIRPTINPDNSLTLRYRSFRQNFPNAAEKSGQGQIGGLKDGSTFFIINPLLNRKSQTNSERELVVFITPRITRENK